MTDVERKVADRGEQRPPERVETYTGVWADAARAAYPEYSQGQPEPDAFLVYAKSTQAEQLKLPALEIDMDGGKAPEDTALAKVEKIFEQLKSDDFATREQGSLQLKDMLRAELAGKKPTPALERIFQLAGSDNPEVKKRVLEELKPAVTEAVNDKDLALLKLFLLSKEPAVRDLATTKLQESPNAVEILSKLAVMSEKEKSTELAEAIRKVAKPFNDLTLFGDVIEKISEPTIDAANNIRKDAVGLSKLDDEPRKEKIKKILDDVKSLTKTADDLQQTDKAALERVLYPPELPRPDDSFVRSYIPDLPFRTRLLCGSALLGIARELKSANKDPKTVNVLQETALSMYKESIALAPLSRYRRMTLNSWAPLLEGLRELNPTRFDELVPDKLLKPE